MTIFTSSTDGSKQFEQQDISYPAIHEPTTPLRSSTDEESCNDDTIQNTSRSILRVSDDGDTLPMISVSNSVHTTTSTSTISLPISEHLAPNLSVDDLVQEVKKEQKSVSSSSSSVLMDAVDDAPTPLDSIKEYQLVSSKWNEPLTQVIQWNESLNKYITKVDANGSKKEFLMLHHMNEKIFSQTNGYDCEAPSKMLNYDGTLIRNHNRWCDIRPWSHNIVQLETPIEETGSHYNGYPVSYVNASHIKLDGQDFISCSAPLPASFDHYWQMIFEQGSDTVVMLTKFIEARRIKAHQYWPDEVGNPVKFGNIEVTLSKVQARKNTGELTSNLKEASIIKRTFTLTCNGKSRTIRHFHYREWPDMGRPDSTSEFITLMKEVNSQPVNGPIVTHCSAGCGRAGTFIILYAYCKKIMREINGAKLPADFILDNYTVNVAVRVLQIRSQRPHMVQKPDQYLFIKEVIATLVGQELQRQQEKETD